MKATENFIEQLKRLLVNPEKDKVDIAEFITKECNDNSAINELFGDVEEDFPQQVATSNRPLSSNELEVIYKAQRKADGMIELYDVEKQTTELKKSVAQFPGKEEARFFTDCYYQIQNIRLGLENQIRAIMKGMDNQQPIEDKENKPGKKKTKILSQNTTFMGYIVRSVRTIEDSIKCGLEEFTNATYLGNWCKETMGIGPVIASCLMAGLDLKDTPDGKDTYIHATNIWSYCGLNDNNRPWLGREKATNIVKECIEARNGVLDNETVMMISGRTQFAYSKIQEAAYNDKKRKWDKEQIIKTCSKVPYNANLKVLMYKIGESFLKSINKEQSLYGRLLVKRRDYEIMKNERGDYADQAKHKLETVNIKKPEVKKIYQSGKLPAGHILARSKRYATKMFISHLYEAMYYNKYGRLAPQPYILVFDEGHTDYIPPEINILAFDRDPEYEKKNPTDPALLPMIKEAKAEMARKIAEREEAAREARKKYNRKKA